MAADDKAPVSAAEALLSYGCSAWHASAHHGASLIWLTRLACKCSSRRLTPHSQVSAAEALSNVARSNVDTQTEIARAGGIGPLLAIVTSRNPHAQAHDDH